MERAQQHYRDALGFEIRLAGEIDVTYEELRSLGARIVEPLEEKPWGLRQFTVEDIDGNRFYCHCDRASAV